MENVRAGREALRPNLIRLGAMADTNGRGTRADAADWHLRRISALDYYGEILGGVSAADRLVHSDRRGPRSARTQRPHPGQPPVPHYAELD
jgi:hypothetical protein